MTENLKFSKKVPFKKLKLSENAQQMGVEAPQILRKILMKNGYIPALVYFCPVDLNFAWTMRRIRFNSVLVAAVTSLLPFGATTF